MVAYRQRWSSEEEEALEAGVNKYGEGKWSRILKDRKFGPVLHFRSNVDLKDKWRNIVFMRDEIARHKIRSVQKSTRKILKRKKKSKDPDFVGGSYRNGDMGGLRCTRKRMKQKTMSLSQVISSDSRVVRNPLEVLRGRSEVSEIDPIKKTTSRLGNLMVDAITKEMEYRESSRTTVPTYLEKGKWVEVLTQEEGFSDSWYMATVIDTPPQNQDSFASPEKYYVEYETLKDDDDSCQLKESVDAQLIRPLCPILSIDSLQVGDIVDAYYYDGWWIGTITKALPNSRFGITFPPPVTEQEFHISELRIHLDWINGHWYNPNTQSRGADNDASYSRPAKKIKTVNIAEFPASTACKTGTINPNSPSKQSTSLANKATKENKFSELDTDTLDIEKRRRRPPNIHKSSTSGNGSNAGLRTAGGIKEKDCGTIISDQNSQGNVSEGLIIEANMEIPTEFIEKAQPIVSSAKLVNPSELSHSIVVGVRTSEGRDCETEDIAPILIDLTCDETISPQCNIPCESPPEGEQTFVITQNNQGSIPERNIIENRAAELQFTVRDSVEVSFEKDNYNVWFPATVLKSFPDNSYLVHFMCKKGQEISPHSATVSLPHIRPKPPQRKSKSKSFVLLDMVDAFHGCAWTRGKIIQEYPDNRFVVSFNRKKTKLFGKYKLRPHMDWVDGRWIDASKSRDDENDASNLRLSKKIKTVNVAEVPTSTACDTDTMSSKLSSKQVMKEKKSSEPSLKNPTIVSRSERPPKLVKPLTNGHESNTGVIKSPLMGQKCSLWDCTRPSAQGFDHCSNHHADLALKEGTLGMNPVLRPGGTGVKESLFYAVLNAKAENKDVGIPECERASTAKCPWNAPELFDINVHENETVRDWLFFDKPRKAFKHGNRKQLSLPDHQGRGWHESRKQVMNEFNAQKKSYYMDPQPNKGFEWHLYEYEIFNFNACVLYRLEYKRVCDKKSTKGKSPNDSVAYLEKQMEIPTGGNERYPGVRSAERTEESDFEMEDSSPILNELPINGMRTPQHDIPCQFPPERSQTFISDQNCQGNVSAGLIIEESMENRLSKLRETSPGLSEPRSRIKIPIESPYSIVDGVRAVEEREEEDSETGGIAPIFIDLTSDETISPQHSSPCQLSLERSGTFIFDQNGGGNFPARLIIEENEENSLTDQVRMSQELLESRNMMELHIENDSCVMSSAKPVKHYVRKRLKRSENPCFESPDLSVDGGTSSKETEVHNVADTSTPGIDHDVNQVLPFKKTLSLWDTIESMEEFRLFPQKPHFRSLENVDEYCREGVALSQMVTFSNIVKKLTEMGIETLRSSKEKCLENLIALEENGFDVRNIRDRLKSLEQESQVMELKKKKRKINEDVDEMDKLLKELGEKRVAAMSKMEIRASATEASRSLLNNINDRVNRIKFDFEEMVATRW